LRDRLTNFVEQPLAVLGLAVLVYEFHGS
jgi:hypothetical protein